MVGEALRLLWERERAREARLAELKEKIRIGIEELDRGEGIEFCALPPTRRYQDLPGKESRV